MLSANSFQNNPYHTVSIAGLHASLGELKHRGWEIAYQNRLDRFSVMSITLEHSAFNGLIYAEADLRNFDMYGGAGPILFEARYFGPKNGLEFMRIGVSDIPSFEPMGDLRMPVDPERFRYEDLSPFSSESKSGIVIPKSKLSDVMWHLDEIRNIQMPEEEEFRRQRLKGAEHKTEFKLVSVG